MSIIALTTMRSSGLVVIPRTKDRSILMPSIANRRSWLIDE